MAAYRSLRSLQLTYGMQKYEQMNIMFVLLLCAIIIQRKLSYFLLLLFKAPAEKPKRIFISRVQDEYLSTS